jgi:hypothetical protein
MVFSLHWELQRNKSLPIRQRSLIELQCVAEKVEEELD